MPYIDPKYEEARQRPPTNPKILAIWARKKKYLKKIEKELETIRSKCTHHFVCTGHGDDHDGWSTGTYTTYTHYKCAKCALEKTEKGKGYHY